MRSRLVTVLTSLALVLGSGGALAISHLDSHANSQGGAASDQYGPHKQRAKIQTSTDSTCRKKAPRANRHNCKRAAKCKLPKCKKHHKCKRRPACGGTRRHHRAHAKHGRHGKR